MTGDQLIVLVLLGCAFAAGWIARGSVQASTANEPDEYGAAQAALASFRDVIAAWRGQEHGEDPDVRLLSQFDRDRADLEAALNGTAPLAEAAAAFAAAAPLLGGYERGETLHAPMLDALTAVDQEVSALVAAPESGRRFAERPREKGQRGRTDERRAV